MPDRTRAVLGSALFLVVVPGTVAVLVPWLLTRWEVTHAVPFGRPAGVVLVALGLPVLLDAFRRFARDGLGTPAPVAPTEHLVVTGAYRFVRNPMYLAVGAIIAGQALLTGSPTLVGYLVAFAVAVLGFVRWYEEPVLRRRYGGEYDDYRRRVPGWLPRGSGGS